MFNTASHEINEHIHTLGSLLGMELSAGCFVRVLITASLEISRPLRQYTFIISTQNLYQLKYFQPFSKTL